MEPTWSQHGANMKPTRSQHEATWESCGSQLSASRKANLTCVESFRTSLDFVVPNWIVRTAEDDVMSEEPDFRPRF